MWSSADGIVQVVVSKGVDGSGQGVRPIRRLVTLFEDGYQIVTFPTVDPSQSDTHRVVVGTGDFLRDHREHMRAVARYAEKNRVAVVPHARLEQLASTYDGYRHTTKWSFRLIMSLATWGTLPVLALMLLPFMYLHGRRNAAEQADAEHDALPMSGFDDEVEAVRFDFDEYSEFEVAEAAEVEAK